MSKLSSFIALVGITLAAAFLFFQLLAVFLLPLFLAVVLAVLLTGLIPAGLLLSLATHEAARVVDQLRDGRVRAQLDQPRTAAGLDLPFAEDWRFLQSFFDLLSADARSENWQTPLRKICGTGQAVLRLHPSNGWHWLVVPRARCWWRPFSAC